MRIWPITTKKRGSRERSSPPCQIRIVILPRCPEARGNIVLDLNTDSKVLRTPGPRWREPCGSRLRTIKRFQAAVYDSIGPPLAFHDPSIAVPVGSPKSDAFGSNPGRVCRPGDASWPPAAILREARKWWASPAGESSHRAIKVVDELWRSA